jgi:conjugative transposon TraM protein
MKIDFKKPKYVFPLIALLPIIVLFYCYKSFAGDEKKAVVNQPELQTDIAGVSDNIKNKDIGNKLDAFKNSYKEGDGYTAVNPLNEEQATGGELQGQYNDREKYILDSIDMAFKAKYSQPSNVRSGSGYMGTGRNSVPQSMSAYQNSGNSRQMSQEDKDLANALSSLNGSRSGSKPQPSKEKYDDPMVLFKEQMKVIDSIGKSGEPDANSVKKQENLLNKVDNVANLLPKLGVEKASDLNSAFNTITAIKQNDFIKAIIDQSITGFAGSRVRIRILEDIKVGKNLIKKGTYIYAIISGFDEQRVKLTVVSIMTDSKILPVKLVIYDLDGMEGLYVPSSSFRAFTKEVSDIGSSIQMQQNPENANQLYMSAISKLFTSTSTAVSKLIKQNKANLKYSTHVYLIDPDELKDQQKNY